MGMITGAIGSVIRDMLINETPLVSRKDVYALVCMAGGIVFMICSMLSASSGMTQLLSAIFVIIIRILVVKLHIDLLGLKARNEEKSY